jgi:hypothetical protein
MAAMRAPTLAPVIPIRTGRPTRAQAAINDARDDLRVHNEEALSFCDAIRPYVDRLEMVATEIGPLAHQTVLTLGALIDRYESRHLPDGGSAA